MKRLNFKEFVEQQPANDMTVVQLYFGQPDMKVREISEKTGKAIGEIYRILNKFGGSPNRQVTNHHNVKLFADNGFGIGQIAKLTGYTERNVRYILGKNARPI